MIDHRLLLAAEPFDGQKMTLRNQDIAYGDHRLRQARETAMREQQMRELFASQGQGIMQADPQALARLAALDPGLAQQAQAQAAQLGMQRERLDLSRQGQQFDQGMAQQRMGMVEQQQEMAQREQMLQRERQETERALAMLSAASTPERWDQIAGQVAPELVGQFQRRDELMRSFMSLKEALSLATPENAPSGYQWNGGNLEFIKGGPADPETIRRTKEAADTGSFERVYGPDNQVVFERGSGSAAGGKPPSERQSMLALFSSQMQQMAPALEALEQRYDPSNLRDAAARNLPLGNYLQSEDGQRYNAAARAWSEGVLRIQTGAAAPEPEIVRVMQTYFAQPGDTPDVVEQKRMMRKGYENSIMAASGGTLQPGQGQGLDVGQGGSQPDQGFEQTKDVGGKRYGKRGGQWFEIP